MVMDNPTKNAETSLYPGNLLLYSPGGTACETIDRSVKEEVIQLTKSYIWKTRYSSWLLNGGTEEKAMIKFISQAAWDDSSDFSYILKKTPNPESLENKTKKNPFKHVKVFPGYGNRAAAFCAISSLHKENQCK